MDVQKCVIGEYVRKETHSDFNSLVTRYLSGELTLEEQLHFQEML